MEKSIRAKMDAIAEQAAKEMLQIFEDVEGSGERMSFMDEELVNYPYSHFTELEDAEANERIRQCFIHAFEEYAKSCLTRAHYAHVKDAVYGTYYQIKGE